MRLGRFAKSLLYYSIRPRRALTRMLGRESTCVPDASLELSAILGRDGPILAVDVGGANDLPSHWVRLRNVARFVVYEPHAASYAELVERQRTDPSYRNFVYVNDALSGEGGTRTLYVTNVPTGSSLIPPKHGGFGDYQGNTYFWPVATSEITTTTLAQSLDRYGVDRIDAIKLDTQGSELEILMGLDPKRFAAVLLVETEVSLLDFYVDGERRLEDMLRFMRERGFSLFDLRTTRFLGSAMALDQSELASILGGDLDLPPNAQRLGEIDAIFIREPRQLLASGAPPSTLRRLIVLLLTYYQFAEAVFVVVDAHRRSIFTRAERDEILTAIRRLQAVFASELGSVADAIRRAGRRTWAQYTWVPYPCA